MCCSRYRRARRRAKDSIDLPPKHAAHTSGPTERERKGASAPTRPVLHGGGCPYWFGGRQRVRSRSLHGRAGRPTVGRRRTQSVDGRACRAAERSQKIASRRARRWRTATLDYWPSPTRHRRTTDNSSSTTGPIKTLKYSFPASNDRAIQPAAGGIQERGNHAVQRTVCAVFALHWLLLQTNYVASSTECTGTHLFVRRVEYCV